jgi:hypothetical protein
MLWSLFFPGDVVDAIFRGLAVKAETGREKQVWEQGRRNIDQISTANESTVLSTDPSPSFTAADTAALVQLLNGPSRREVSNKLIAEYHVNPKGTVSALVAAIQPEMSASAYRVNLYILFTLARIPGNWLGTSDQIEAIRSLSRSGNMTDPTYARWAAQAVKRASPL